MRKADSNYLPDNLVLQQLGVTAKKSKLVYQASDGSRLIIRNNSDSTAKYYWYNIQRSLFSTGIDACICVTGSKGFYRIPFSIIENVALSNQLSYTIKGNYQYYKLVLEKQDGVMVIRVKNGTGESISIESYFYPAFSETGYTEVGADARNLYEGAVRSIYVNAYERNPDARRKCIAHYGAVCQVCGFDFGKAYGNEFSGIIEVHHIVPLAMVNKKYCVNPIDDLIPVCPNCHAALHAKKSDGATYSVAELQNRIREKDDENDEATMLY